MSTNTASSLSSSASQPTQEMPRGGLHIGLWVTQVLLALAFVGAGQMKLFTPLDALGAKMAWVTHAPAMGVRLLGLAELLGGLGLVFPAALRIAPKLTPLAAALLVPLMLGAVGTHVMMNEAAMSMPAVILGALCVFVAWGRGVKAPIPAR